MEHIDEAGLYNWVLHMHTLDLGGGGQINHTTWSLG